MLPCLIAVLFSGLLIDDVAANGGGPAGSAVVSAVRCAKRFDAIAVGASLDAGLALRDYRVRGVSRNPFRSENSTTLGANEQSCSVKDAATRWCSISSGHTENCSVIGGQDTGVNFCSVTSNPNQSDPRFKGDCSVKESSTNLSKCSTINPAAGSSGQCSATSGPVNTVNACSVFTSGSTPKKGTCSVMVAGDSNTCSAYDASGSICSVDVNADSTATCSASGGAAAAQCTVGGSTRCSVMSGNTASQPAGAPPCKGTK